MERLIFGCGYLGDRVGRLWRDDGDSVTIVTRGRTSPNRRSAADFARQGYHTIVADITRPASLTALPAANTVLYSIGFDHTSGQSITNVFSGGIRSALAALPAATVRFIYISTTGVHGDAAGNWIDEQTPTAPRREGGLAALAAEQALTAHSLGKNAVILRLAGLYGPGRLPFLDQLRVGEAIPVAGEGFLNLIHVDDAARITVAAGELAPFNDGPRIYCVSDGQPVPRRDFYREVAHQLAAPPPTFTEPEPGSSRAARAAANRRVRNDRMLRELGVQLTYPDYRAGLAAILETQDQQATS